MAPRKLGAPILGEIRQGSPSAGWAGADALLGAGVEVAFTLSGGHLFPLYDGAARNGLPLVDLRHEQAVVHAAEGWAKVTRRPAVAMVTAGPGVTNAMTPITTAWRNGSPLLVVGGRAPSEGWGRRALQEIDHPALVREVTRAARTLDDPGQVGEEMARALGEAWEDPPGPVFVDVPIDVLRAEAPPVGAVDQPLSAPRPAGDLSALAASLARAERPVLIAGTDLHWAHAEAPLRAVSEAQSLPVFANGMGRGLLPASHPNHRNASRRQALADADLIIVAGAPIDFRLGFGMSPPFNRDADAFVLTSREESFPPHTTIAGGLAAALAELATLPRPDESVVFARSDWLARLAEVEKRARDAADQLLANSDRLHPLHVYRALEDVLDADAFVVGDGGDFVSYAGQAVATQAPGRFLDPGSFGTLGVGPGYALAAQLAHPTSQVALLLGDGAFGYLPMEFDSMRRHGAPVVAIVGNNGGQMLEKLPMEERYGFSVAADYGDPELRYDEIVVAMGGHGEMVRTPSDLRPALSRAFEAGVPACVNVLIDPEARYPRVSALS